MSAVQPALSCRFKSAPAPISACIVVPWPLQDPEASAVQPSLLGRFKSAPAPISACTVAV
jgi:hypothetical protein